MPDTIPACIANKKSDIRLILEAFLISATNFPFDTLRSVGHDFESFCREQFPFGKNSKQTLVLLVFGIHLEVKKKNA